MTVRAKQRLCYQRYLVTLNLRVAGFAPRDLNRWAFSLNFCHKIVWHGVYIENTATEH